MANLEKSSYGLYFTEHMRNVIENGFEYTEDHLSSILKTLTPIEFDYTKTPECVWALKLIIKGMNLSEWDFASVIEGCCFE